MQPLFAFLFSPPVRGSTPVIAYYLRDCRVFPASAGVNLIPSCIRRKRVRFPRQCGGHPPLHLHDGDLLPFSPPVRGSALIKIAIFICRFVFPASAGINLKVQDLYQSTSGFPRQCGGQPSRIAWRTPSLTFSPPVRGSPYHSPRSSDDRKVFPADAGVIK